MSNQAQAHAGDFNVNSVNGNSVMGHYTYQPGNATTITVSDSRTSLEVFEELVGLIKLIELKLNLDTKDGSKHKWLELIMGRIQEETINDTLHRLKALEL